MDLRLPKLGEGADSGVVVSILVKEGDRIAEGQTLLELENEKAVAPIPASASGTIAQIRVKEGDRISVGQVILTLADAGEAAPREDEPAARPAEPVETTAPEEEPPPPGKVIPAEAAAEFAAQPAAKVAASPAIRRLSRELGIDLSRVRGTERGGRIGMTDLRDYIQALQRLAFAPKPAAGPPKPPPPEPVDYSKWGPIRRQPVSELRKVVARRMSESWATVPRVTQFDEADITGVMELRKTYAPAYESRGARLTLTSFAVRAVVETLKAHPLFNSSLDEASGEIVFKDYYHIGLAVDTEAGLLVPVLRDADRKNLFELSKEIEELAAKARDRKVSLEELRGGSFTLSNQGGIGSAHFTPIVNKPEVAILGLGRGRWLPVMREEQIVPRLMLPLALSYDHRVIDGGSAARFLVDLVRAFADFPEALVKL